MISALIFNITQSDAYAFAVHSNVHKMLQYTVSRERFHGLWLTIVIDNGSHQLVFLEHGKEFKCLVLA